MAARGQGEYAGSGAATADSAAAARDCKRIRQGSRERWPHAIHCTCVRPAAATIRACTHITLSRCFRRASACHTPATSMRRRHAAIRHRCPPTGWQSSPACAAAWPQCRRHRLPAAGEMRSFVRVHAQARGGSDEAVRLGGIGTTSLAPCRPPAPWWAAHSPSSPSASSPASRCTWRTACTGSTKMRCGRRHVPACPRRAALSGGRCNRLPSTAQAQIGCVTIIVSWLCCWLMWIGTWLHQWHPIISACNVAPLEMPACCRPCARSRLHRSTQSLPSWPI